MNELLEQAQMEPQEVQAEEEADEWAKAFEFLASRDAGAAGVGEQQPDPGSVDDGAVQSGEEPDNPELDQPDPIGPGDDPGEAGAGDGGTSAFIERTSLEAGELEDVKKSYQEKARQQAIDEVVESYIKQGVRNSNGRLGATLSDPDICRVDESGVTRYYNPDTKREFSGDNPRAQAQAWCDSYNKELQRQFNEGCAKMEKKFIEEYSPAIRVLEFAPKYDNLDEVRRGMLDDIIEDYEIHDKDGELIGYSCDLDKALAMVERQVARLQGFAKARKPAVSPVTDIKASQKTATDVPEKKEFKSIAEAMEWQQDQLLAKRRK